MGVLMCDQDAHDGNRFVLGFGDNLVAMQHLAMASLDSSLWFEECSLWPNLYRRRPSSLESGKSRRVRFMCTVCTNFFIVFFFFLLWVLPRPTPPGQRLGSVEWVGLILPSEWCGCSIIIIVCPLILWEVEDRSISSGNIGATFYDLAPGRTWGCLESRWVSSVGTHHSSLFYAPRGLLLFTCYWEWHFVCTRRKRLERLEKDISYVRPHNPTI